MTTVFLSHSSQDKVLARRVAVELGMSDIQVWFDEWKILVGDSIVQEVSRGLDDADYVVVMLTGASVRSGWVDKEWQSKIYEEAGSRRVHVLPLLCEDCEIPRLLRDKNYADIRSDFNDGISKLIHSVNARAGDLKPVTAGARVRSGRIVVDELSPRLPLVPGMVLGIRAGCFVRNDGKLQAHMHIQQPHVALQRLGEMTGIDRMILESESYSISVDATAPSHFIARQTFRLEAGASVPDLVSGQEVRLPVAMIGSAETVVEAHVSGDQILGVFRQTIAFNLPGLERTSAVGSFEAAIALG